MYTTYIDNATGHFRKYFFYVIPNTFFIISTFLFKLLTGEKNTQFYNKNIFLLFIHSTKNNN